MDKKKLIGYAIGTMAKNVSKPTFKHWSDAQDYIYELALDKIGFKPIPIYG